MLGQRGIKPESLPPSEDIKKLERRVKSQQKRRRMLEFLQTTRDEHNENGHTGAKLLLCDRLCLLPF